MPNYRRWYEGRTFFFTVVTEQRTKFLCNPSARARLRAVMIECRRRRQFTVNAIVLLPDHLHTIWTLPPNDSHYSKRWAWIKRTFTATWLATTDGEKFRTTRKWQRRRGLFQPRFWEHTIRNEDDFVNHINYIHFNPVKHGYVQWPSTCPYSTFQRFVRPGWYPPRLGQARR